MHLSIVLVGIAAVSAIGMSLYPMQVHALSLSDQEAGFFLGASIHDVAQALGAGASIVALVLSLVTAIVLL